MGGSSTLWHRQYEKQESRERDDERQAEKGQNESDSVTTQNELENEA
jgi:hypothetical protein